MIETMEAIVWCAALATWIMMFFGILAHGFRKLSSRFGRKSEAEGRLRP